MSGVHTSIKTLKAENKRLRKKVADLQQENEVLRQQIVTLTIALSALQKKVAELSRNSSTSSKPPSSDVVKPPSNKKGKKKRKRGGQPGHPKHERPAFSQEEVTDFYDYYLEACPDCGNDLESSEEAPRVIHRRDTMTEKRFQAKLAEARDNFLAKAKRAPDRREAQNMAERFHKHGKAYFEFITTPGIEPTNNLAEQAIRFVVIDRRITQGTRGASGRTWCERIWTVIATCAQQGRSVFGFLFESLLAHFAGRTGPSLLPDTS